MRGEGKSKNKRKACCYLRIFGRGGDSGAVSTSNYEARKFGVKAGIPISLAKKLAPHAIFLPVNMELYHTISDDVMEILKEYSENLSRKV